MPRTPGEHAGWLGAIGLVVRVLGSILELAIVSFSSIWGVWVRLPLKLRGALAFSPSVQNDLISVLVS